MEPTGLFLMLAWLQILPRLASSEGPVSSPDRSRPLKPVLRLHPPGPRYQAGDTVTLTCSAPLLTGRLGFQFVHGSDAVRVGASPETSRSFQIPSLGPEHAGAHTCRYWVEQGGQESPFPESDPVSIEVTAPPAAPTLSLQPPEPFYLPGERVTLRCSAPGGEGPQGYRFYRGQEGPILEELQTPDGGARLEIVAEMGNAGPYTCGYWTLQSGRQIPSERSRPVSLSVRAPPVAPTISLHPPEPFYLPGERVTLRCSALAGTRPLGYRFYRGQEGPILEELQTPDGGARLEIVAEMGNAGPYTCAYWTLKSGRQIPSERSQPVSLSVRAHPPAPALSLQPPEPFYLPGERVTLRCSAPGGEGPRGYRFHETQTGRILEELPTRDGGARLEIVAKMGNAGPYSCVYWTQKSGREIQSMKSQPVSLSVRDPPAPPTLSLGSPNPVYYQGEQIHLSCSAPAGEGVTGYRFYRGRGDRPPEGLPSPSGAARLELRAETGAEGPYTCRYWRRVSGKEILSGESNEAHITVLGPPAAATLSLHPPETFYLPGERVTLRCSAPGGEGPRGYRFYRGQEGRILEELQTPDGGARLEIVAEMGNAGPYTCAYWTLQSGRLIPSERSRLVYLSVRAPPLAPTLSLHPPHAVYLPGERVNLSCLAPGAQDVTGYGFYMARPEQGAEELPPRRGGPRLEIQAAMGDEGPYTCWYWSRVSGREIPSGLSRPVAVPVADRPGSPSVSVSPDYPAYVAGERVEIRCSAPPGASPPQYEFYETGEPLGDWAGNASSWQTDLPASGTGNVTLSYSCVYTELVQGRLLPSLASEAVSLAVFPAPAPPTLWLSPPQLLYVTGETVTVECLIPPGPHLAQTHTVLKDGHPLLETAGPPVALNVSPSDNGTYSCGYSVELRGRHLPAPHSRPVPLGVIDPPPRPALSVDPTSGAVSEGLPLNITCTAPGAAAERRFHFYKDGAEFVPGAMGSEISPTEPGAGARDISVLRFPRAGPNSTGEFTCGYEENMRGRWVPSPRSRAVKITLTAWALPIPLIAGCGGAAWALALLLVLVCVCRRKKSAGRRLSTSYWKSRELRRSRIMRQSADISGVNIALQQKTQGGWPHEAPQDWGLLPKFPTEGPRPGRAAGGAAPPKCQKGDEDADSGAEFEFPDIDPTYTLLTFSSSTFRQGQGPPGPPEPVYSSPTAPPHL